MFNNSRPIKSPVAYSAIEYHIRIKMNGMLKENAKLRKYPRNVCNILKSVLKLYNINVQHRY